MSGRCAHPGGCPRQSARSGKPSPTYIGAGFVLLTIAGLLLAQLLLTADSVAVWIATLGVAALGPVTLPGPPLRYDDRGRTEHTAPPVLGQHNESVRAWLDEMDDAARRR